MERLGGMACGVRIVCGGMACGVMCGEAGRDGVWSEDSMWRDGVWSDVWRGDVWRGWEGWRVE